MPEGVRGGKSRLNRGGYFEKSEYTKKGEKSRFWGEGVLGGGGCFLGLGVFFVPKVHKFDQLGTSRRLLKVFRRFFDNLLKVLHILVLPAALLPGLVVI